MPLDAVSLPDGTVEHDFSVSAGYQAYSAELLRLSLAGVAGVGFLIAHATEKNSFPAGALAQIGPALLAALTFFGVAASFGVLHRYLSGDSLAHSVEALRLLKRGSDGDLARRRRVITKRNLQFQAAGWSLIASGVSLLGGVPALWVSFSRWLSIFSA
jgi:hypothetical protein